MYIRALQGTEEALGPKHISTFNSVIDLGIVYKNQGKLDKVEAMCIRALQGYEDALGPQFVSSYLSALNIIFIFGNLLSQTGRKDIVKEMYARALSGYKTVQGLSSKWCRQLEDRLQALQSISPELEVGQDKFIEPVAQEPRGLKRKHSANRESG